MLQPFMGPMNKGSSGSAAISTLLLQSVHLIILGSSKHFDLNGMRFFLG